MTITTTSFISVLTGTVANDGTGDDLRTAFSKVNGNFSNISTIGFNAANISASGTIEAVYFVGDGSQLTAIPTSGLYSNSNVASYLTTYNNTLSANTLTTSGPRVETGFQFYNPTANVAITGNINASRVILAPIGTISFGANITLPPGNINGRIFSISSNVATTLSVMPSNGTKLSPFGNVQLTAGTNAEYMYQTTDTTWYKIG